MKSNCKYVKNLIRIHIGDYYSDTELKDQVDAIKCNTYPTDYHAVYHMVESGCFLIYNHDIIAFLDSLGINPNNKKYDEYDSFKLYCHLIARDAQLILRHVN